MLNPFLTNNAFTTASLTDAINKLPFVPGKVTRLGLFAESGVATTSILIEEKDGVLSLVETTPRGAPAVQHTSPKRKVRSLAIPHIAYEDTVKSDQVQNVRAFGSESAMEGVQTVVNQKIAEMTVNLDATYEHLLIGALKGIALDADESTPLYNLFTEFGVTQYDEIDFDLDNASPAKGAVRKKCHDIQRKICDVLGSAVYDHIHCFCSSQFWEDLISHPEVSAAYDRPDDGLFLRMGLVYGQFFYAGIVFEEYRGKAGSVNFIADDKAHFFPVGVPNLFKTYFAPADFRETSNTLGMPRYAKRAPADHMERSDILHIQTNPLPICTRPKVLIKAKRT